MLVAGHLHAHEQLRDRDSRKGDVIVVGPIVIHGVPP